MSDTKSGTATNAIGAVVDVGHDIVFMSIRLYDFFLAHGKEGRIARDVYLHLFYTARRQETVSVWAEDAYLRKGLGIGQKAVERAKSFLRKHDLIDYRQRRPDKENPRAGKMYILVRMPGAGPSKTAPAENSWSCSAKQILSGINRNARRRNDAAHRSSFGRLLDMTKNLEIPGVRKNTMTVELSESLEAEGLLLEDYLAECWKHSRGSAATFLSKLKAREHSDDFRDVCEECGGKRGGHFLSCARHPNYKQHLVEVESAGRRYAETIREAGGSL